MPCAARASSTRPVISGQVGSSMALWSAKGTLLRNSQLLSASKAAHPPSEDCMAKSQSSARRWQACCATGSEARAAPRASITMAVSSTSGWNSLEYSKAQPEGSVLGRFTDQSPLRRTSLSSSQSAARSEEHTSELQSLRHLVCRLLLGE